MHLSTDETMAHAYAIKNQVPLSVVPCWTNPGSQTQNPESLLGSVGTFEFN